MWSALGPKLTRLRRRLRSKALVQLAESVGVHAVPSSVELHVSQRELGNMAAGSRESVNKQLQTWQ